MSNESEIAWIGHRLRHVAARQKAADDDLAVISKKIMAACRGLSQKQIADLMGHSKAYINDLIHKRRPWTLKLLRKLHAGLTAKKKGESK